MAGHIGSLPLTYYGGKSAYFEWLIKNFPQNHSVYVECFGGSGAVALCKQAVDINIYSDIEPEVVNFYRVLKSEGGYKHLLGELENEDTNEPSVRLRFYELRDMFVKQQFETDADRAYAFLYLNVWGMNGVMAGQSGCAWAKGKQVRWLSRGRALDFAHKKLLRYSVEQADAFGQIAKYDSPETFFYLDPPYIMETRKTKNKNTGYACELPEAKHEELVGMLLQIKGSVLLSGYDHPIYYPLEDAGWFKILKNVDLCLPAGAVKRTEAIWRNYAKGLFE